MRLSPHIGPSRTPFGKQRGAGQARDDAGVARPTATTCSPPATSPVLRGLSRVGGLEWVSPPIPPGIAGGDPHDMTRHHPGGRVVGRASRHRLSRVTRSTLKLRGPHRTRSSRTGNALVAVQPGSEEWPNSSTRPAFCKVGPPLPTVKVLPSMPMSISTHFSFDLRRSRFRGGHLPLASVRSHVAQPRGWWAPRSRP
jgi:hypothetical protein